jgi:hypothetical protein
MNKKLTWKQTLLVGVVSYGIDFLFGTSLPVGISAVLEIVGLASLVIGIIGGIKAGLSKNKPPENHNQTKKK